MPIWSDTPPSDEERFSYRIVRTPPDKSLQAIVTSGSIEGCPTHYAHSRTIPCEGLDTCKLCEAGHSWRWHGYVSAVLITTMEHVLFEFTATASDTFKTFHGVNGTLRGCSYTAWRPSKKPNGRVVISCKHADTARVTLPPPPNIRKILCHIWNIQYTQTELTTGRSPADKNIDVGNNGKDGRYQDGTAKRLANYLGDQDPDK